MIVSVDGAELFYSSRGVGPVCLVPSAVGTRAYERQMPPQLSEGRQLVFVDLRGGGQSTGDPATLTFDRLADDLEAVRVDLGVDTVDVIGHSIIGALKYGRRFCRRPRGTCSCAADTSRSSKSPTSSRPW